MWLGAETVVCPNCFVRAMRKGRCKNCGAVDNTKS